MSPSLRIGLRRIRLRVLPRAWALRWDIRATDRYYRMAIAKAKTANEVQSLRAEWQADGRMDEEELEAIRTQRILRRAGRYDIVPPDIPYNSEMERDDFWERGHDTGKWYLTVGGISHMSRQIEEAQHRRAQLWQVRVNAVGGLISGLIALVSALVSLALALKK